MKVLERDSLRLVSGGGGGKSSPSFGEVGAVVGAMGSGVGSAYWIEGAGGLRAMGALAPAAATGLFTGFLGFAYAGWSTGGWLYENSETVRETAIGTVENVLKDGFLATANRGMEQVKEMMWGGGGGGGGGAVRKQVEQEVEYDYW